MARRTRASGGRDDERIAAVVRRLREAEAELQSLTGGQIDAVIGARDGAYLLRGAQERLQHSERVQRQLAMLQASILDALPAHIALLNGDGVIVTVNESWRRFATANVLGTDDFAVGHNYLTVCDRATGECSAEAPTVAAGIRGVLDGTNESFVLEYPCHAPGEQRWFRLMVTPINERRDGGAVVMHINVTDRQLAELALVRAAEEQRELAAQLTAERERLLTAQAVAKVGSWETDYLTFESRWSAETFRIFGLDPATFHPTHDAFLLYVHPDDRDAVNTAFADSFGTRALCSIQHRIVRPDGTTRFVEERWNTVADGLGSPLRAVGTCQDITERHAAMEALHVSEERFRLLSRATNDAIRDWDIQTGQVWWNEGLESLFGYARDEMAATLESWSARLHPEDRDQVVEGLCTSVKAHEPHWSAEYRFRRKDGSYAYVLDRGHIIRDADGRAIRLIGGLTDLTSRREAEQRLAQQAALLDAAHDAIIVKDMNDRVVYWNKGAERVYGWSAGDAIGKSARELFGVDPTAYSAAMASLLEQGQWEGELTKMGRDGRARTVDIRWTLMRDERGEPARVFAINADVTERKQLEGQLLRAQRMESLGTLAGGIAHDLNNVLAPILMSVELLRTDDDDAEREAALTTVESAARRGADMVKQVLYFARGVNGERRPVKAAGIIRDVDRIMRDTLPKDIAIRVAVDPDLWTITGDSTQIHQVLMNLCVNARDAMPHGGSLVITASNTVLDEIYAGMHPQSHPGAYVKFEVSDTGEGISHADQERIFEPFFTTKELGKGTGLGLSTVHTIVRTHGGFVTLYSELGKGARFAAFFPAHAVAPEADEVAVTQTRLPRGQGELILVVDDEESIRVVVQQTLERFGYRVLLAANGAEAISVYVQHHGTVDLVLTDMAMPVMDGAATIIALKSIDRGVLIIGSSGLTTNDGIAKALGAGVSEFVPKPYTAEALLRAVRRSLDSRNQPNVPAP